MVLKTVDVLPLAPEDEVIYKCKDQYFRYQDGEYKECKLEGQVASMNLYDLNQSIISQLDPITDFTDSIELINSWASKEPDEYFMLLNKDTSYYTLFKAKTKKKLEFNSLGEAVITCLKEISNLRSVSLAEGAIELWADFEDDLRYFYLFPYDKGIVEYRR